MKVGAAAFVLLFLFSFSLHAQPSSGNVVRYTDASGNIIPAGDNANNALRVNVVAGASGGTSSSFGSAFPATGTAAGFSDGTNMQGARVFDLDSGAGTQYAAGVNLRRTANGGSVELVGQATMANSVPVGIASDQSSFGVAATQSGTWTVQPGNTANTAPWFVKTIPYNGCTGTTLQDISQAGVGTGAGTALTSADTCVFQVYFSNITALPCTITLQDKQGTPFVYSNTFTLSGFSDLIRDFGGMKFISGVQAIAGTANCINSRLMGVQ